MQAPPPIPAYAPGTFARFTIDHRLPKILADARAPLDARERHDPRWQALETALSAGSRIDLALFSAPTPFWERKLESLSGMRWDELSFFELEFAFYRAIDSIAGALRPGLDVFAPIRRAALAEALPRVARALDAIAGEPTLDAALTAALAGNEADLSQLSRPYAETADALLLDDRAKLVKTLAEPGGSIVLLADNAGSELCFDFVLVDVLLTTCGGAVELHCKPRPMFVSDALVSDVEETLRAFRSGPSSALAGVGARLEAAREQGRLLVSAPADWAEPRHMDMLAPELAASLRSARVVVAKGDLNSRRFFGDRSWPPTTPVSVASVATNMRAFALRVLKSDCVVGLPSSVVERLFAAEPAWRSNGRHSVIQRVDRDAP